MIELRNLDQHSWNRGPSARNKLKVAHRRKKGSAAALRILPSLALFKAKSRKEARDTVKLSPTKNKLIPEMGAVF